MMSSSAFRFKQYFIDGVMSDSLGYAGTEIIRRTVGDSKVMELDLVKDPEIRIPMERALVRVGVQLIMERSRIRTGKDTAEVFEAEA